MRDPDPAQGCVLVVGPEQPHVAVHARERDCVPPQRLEQAPKLPQPVYVLVDPGVQEPISVPSGREHPHVAVHVRDRVQCPSHAEQLLQAPYVYVLNKLEGGV